MARTLSTVAECAKMIRQDLKNHFPGIKASVTSERYSGGNSVSVGIMDIHPTIYRQINDLLAKYEYGKFDGMNDIYEYSNVRKDIPQTKYLFVRNGLSSELRNEIETFIKDTFAPGDSIFKDLECEAWRMFCDENSLFWRSRQQAAA